MNDDLGYLGAGTRGCSILGESINISCGIGLVVRYDRRVEEATRVAHVILQCFETRVTGSVQLVERQE